MFDTSKPDGMMRKVLDVSRLRELGWTAQIGFREGVERTYEWFEAQSPDAIRGYEAPALAH